MGARQKGGGLPRPNSGLRSTIAPTSAKCLSAIRRPALPRCPMGELSAHVVKVAGQNPCFQNNSVRREPRASSISRTGKLQFGEDSAIVFLCRGTVCRGRPHNGENPNWAGRPPAAPLRSQDMPGQNYQPRRVSRRTVQRALLPQRHASVVVGQKIDARKAALRELIPAGEGHAVLSGACKLVEVDHLALAYPGFQRCSRGRPAAFGVLPLWGLSRQTVPRPQKTIAESFPNCNFPVREIELRHTVPGQPDKSASRDLGRQPSHMGR